MAMFERTRRSGRFACLATIFAIAVAFVPGAQCVAFGENVSAVRGQEWAVDPTVPGENIPGEGRSLFDFLVARSRDGKIELAVPFPLEALVARIESELQPPLPGVPAMKAVLIPRGRSLQRSAGEPRPYVYPRVVMAVDTESRLSARDAGKLLKDRVYLGYHEKAEILEVISYNEAAGRFEFQVVKDYRAGGIPRVFYANRAVCTACHQNAAPIFARQLWDETNANVVVAARLARERQRFYGISPNRGVDVPYAVDNATDRANLQSAYQLLWRDGCQAARDSASAIRCRAALFTAALQYRMTDRQQYQHDAPELNAAASVLRKFAQERFPSGMRIPNPDLPNRIVAISEEAGPESGREVAAAFDPLVPRAALDVWEVGQRTVVDRLVSGLSEFIAENDVRRLDAHLDKAAASGRLPAATFETACSVARSSRAGRDRYEFTCVARPGGVALKGRFYATGNRITDGVVEQLAFAGGGQGVLRDIDIVGGRVARDGSRRSARMQLARARMHARTAVGDAVAGLNIDWDVKSASRPDDASATVRVVRDFSAVTAAIADIVQHAPGVDAFSSRPFRRPAIFKPLFERLHMPPLVWCCDDTAGMPAATMEDAGENPHVRPLELEPFYRYCATCHQSPDRSPPNFLQGSTPAVYANLAHCAQRLHVRLSMWEEQPAQRVKTAMPPAYALSGLHVTQEAWRSGDGLAALRAFVARLLLAETGAVPATAALMRNGYENLRECLP